jgi:hypothetical protein
MNFKLAVYVECPTCGGRGLVQGFNRFVPCKAETCKDGYRTVLVTPQEMGELSSGVSIIEPSGDGFRVVPKWEHHNYDPACPPIPPIRPR